METKLRTKNYNYTKNYEKLINNLKDWKNGTLEFSSPKELLMASGYTEDTALKYASGASTENVKQAVNTVFPTAERLSDVMDIIGMAKVDAKYSAALKGHDMLNKMTGAYAEDNKLDVNVTADITVEHNVGDFKAFLEMKRKKKLESLENSDEVIDGEVVKYD